MDKQILVDAINRHFNNYYRRRYARTGAGRYFDQEYFSVSELDADPELCEEIVETIKSLKEVKTK